MILFNILSHKYTDDKISRALEEWAEDSKTEPALHSLESCLMNNGAPKKTNIIIYRKYPIYERFTFPSHYYMTVGNKIWHPGYGDDINIFQTETPSDNAKNSIIEIKEKCNYCIYWEMYRNFQSDKHFNIMTNNCQVVMGMFTETICILIIMISLVFAALTGYYIFLVVVVFFFVVLFVFSFSTHCTHKYTFSSCPHILPIRHY